MLIAARRHGFASSDYVEGNAVSVTSRRLSAGLLAVSAALALSGCGSTAGSAAVVGDTRVSVNDLQTATKQFRAAGVPWSAGQVLSMLVLAPAVLPSAGKLGFAQSDADACKALAQAAEQSGGKAPNCSDGSVSPATLLAVRTAVVTNGVRANLRPQTVTAWWTGILAGIEKSGVQVNPRFGTWNPPKLDLTSDTWDFVVQPTAPGWLLTPSASVPASPSPSPSP